MSPGDVDLWIRDHYPRETERLTGDGQTRCHYQPVLPGILETANSFTSED